MRPLYALIALATTANALPTGDQRLSYRLPGAEAPLTYRVYVPAAWRAGEHWPLVMILHGFGGNADRPFEQGGQILREAADRHRFIVVAPAGYDGKGDWGANLPLPVSSPAASRAMDRSTRQNQLAEADALAVFARVSRSYRTDLRRAFVVGNSMGMTGTMHFAIKYPRAWCGMGASGGPPWPNYPLARLRVKGAFLAHGEADDRAAIADTRALYAEMQAVGLDARFMPIPGGVHSTAWVQAIPAMFAYFDTLPCGAVKSAR